MYVLPLRYPRFLPRSAFTPAPGLTFTLYVRSLPRFYLYVGWLPLRFRYVDLLRVTITLAYGYLPYYVVTFGSGSRGCCSADTCRRRAVAVCRAFVTFACVRWLVTVRCVAFAFGWLFNTPFHIFTFVPLPVYLPLVPGYCIRSVTAFAASVVALPRFIAAACLPAVVIPLTAFFWVGYCVRAVTRFTVTCVYIYRCVYTVTFHVMPPLPGSCIAVKTSPPRVPRYVTFFVPAVCCYSGALPYPSSFPTPVHCYTVPDVPLLPAFVPLPAPVPG